MANANYDEFRNAQLGNATHSVVDLDTDNIRIGLRDEGTTAIDLSTHVDHADISSALVDVTSDLTSTTVGSVAVGTFDHADATISAVTGASVESLDYYKWSGTSATSPLMFNLDSWTGLPLTPNGGDVTLAPHANGVFNLGAS